MNLNKLEQKRKEIILNFTEEELVNYVQQLTEKYYLTYINNESESYYTTVSYLKELISLFKVKYPELNNYINLCLVRSINKILNETLASEMKLELIEEPEEELISNQPFQPLINAFYESRKLYFKDNEDLNRLKELEQENKELKELLNNG